MRVFTLFPHFLTVCSVYGKGHLNGKTWLSLSKLRTENRANHQCLSANSHVSGLNAELVCGRGELMRARLRKMTDAELLAFGKAARHMCSPAANLQAASGAFVIQLRLPVSYGLMGAAFV
jgi:hypothetical protein